MHMTVIVRQLQDNETTHGPVLDGFNKWCDESRLN